MVRPNFMSRVSCKEIDSSLSVCINGLGLGMFLSYQVAPFRKNGRLKYVLEQFEPDPIPVHVVYAHANILSNRMHAFVNECVEKLRQMRFE
jgi:DNA-binding transcriptional LysR family regulator